MTRAQRAAADAREIQRAAASIVAVYLDAPTLTRSAGHRWYSEEAARCADFGRRYGIPAENVAGAAAAISPGMRWDAVFANLAALRDNPAHGVPTYSREFVRRALRCMAGENPDVVLSGPKVRAFWLLLSQLDLTAVVIDGHAWNICRLDPVVFRRTDSYAPPPAARVNARRYRIATAAYREAAADIGRPAHAVQAATWLHWRNLTARNAPVPF